MKRLYYLSDNIRSSFTFDNKTVIIVSNNESIAVPFQHLQSFTTDHQQAPKLTFPGLIGL